MDTPDPPRLLADGMIPTMTSQEFQKMLENLRQGGATVPPCTPPNHRPQGAQGAQGIMSASPIPWWSPTPPPAHAVPNLPRSHTVFVTGSTAASPSPPPAYSPINSPRDSYVWPSIQSIAASTPTPFSIDHTSCRRTLEQLKSQHSEQIDKMNKEIFQAQVDMWYARDEHAKTKDLLAAAKQERDSAPNGLEEDVIQLREQIRDLVRERDVARMEGVEMKEELSEVKGELEGVRMELGFVKAEKERLRDEVGKYEREKEMRELEEMVEKQLKIKKDKEEERRLQMVPGAFPASDIEVFRSAV
ncbi:hypothetical protein FPQ18DRAFT_308462 [Pyronema domesticum]|nr:hypothetical protein FPQ18DRAFT_308462 [Pyronema domesticum]